MLCFAWGLAGWLTDRPLGVSAHTGWLVCHCAIPFHPRTYDVNPNSALTPNRTTGRCAGGHAVVGEWSTAARVAGARVAPLPAPPRHVPPRRPAMVNVNVNANAGAHARLFFWYSRKGAEGVWKTGQPPRQKCVMCIERDVKPFAPEQNRSMCLRSKARVAAGQGAQHSRVQPRPFCHPTAPLTDAPCSPPARTTD